MILKKIKGLKSTQTNMLKPTIITVRFTSDKMGETLSLSDNDDTVMLTVPFEPLAKIIDEERKKS